MPTSNNVVGPSEPADYWDQMDLSPEELAILFAAKGWVYGNGAVLTADDIRGKILHLIDVIESANDDGVWSNLGRLMVTQDPEYPSYYSISLELGLIPKEGD